MLPPPPSPGTDDYHFSLNIGRILFITSSVGCIIFLYKVFNVCISIFVASSPEFTTELPSTTNGVEGGQDVVLTVQVTGDYTSDVSWYRNGILANNVTFPISSLKTGQSTQSNLTIKSPNRNSNAVFLAKAVYGTHSPQSNMSVSLDVWCKYASTHRLNFFVSNRGIGELGDTWGILYKQYFGEKQFFKLFDRVP